jgi:hypothetical protein
MSVPPYDHSRDRPVRFPPGTVAASRVSTGASKGLYQERTRTILFSKKSGRIVQPPRRPDLLLSKPPWRQPRGKWIVS